MHLAGANGKIKYVGWRDNFMRIVMTRHDCMYVLQCCTNVRWVCVCTWHTEARALFLNVWYVCHLHQHQWSFLSLLDTINWNLCKLEPKIRSIGETHWERESLSATWKAMPAASSRGLAPASSQPRLKGLQTQGARFCQQPKWAVKLIFPKKEPSSTNSRTSGFWALKQNSREPPRHLT